MTELQTRPELNKQEHHLLHEAIGNEEKCKDCDYYQKRDFHAKPFAWYDCSDGQLHDEEGKRLEGARLGSVIYRDGPGDFDSIGLYYPDDVLLEREAYEKEIANNEHYWKATAANWQAQWRMQADFRKQDDLKLKEAEARVKELEKRLKEK